MKKFLLVVLSFLLLAPTLAFAGCKRQDSLSSYDLKVNYDALSHTAQCKLTLSYFNASDNALKELKFHLYPNAFSEGEEKRVSTSATELKVYPNSVSYGGIEILSVSENSKIAQGEVSEDKMLLSVPLEKELYPDERTKIDIDFSLSLPNVLHRFGWSENSINFANFYPIACVYEDGKGFATDPYVANGDPFYSETANYSLTVTYPESLILACSGDNVTTQNNSGVLTTSFKMEKVRDASFVLSDKFEKISGKAGKTNIDYYFYDDPDPSLSLQTGVDAVKFYSDKFGDYPFSSLAIVQTGFVHGGMEYPRLVMISDSVKGEDYQYVIAHEIAHQWWYSVVGNDEFNEAWLDESLAEYSTALFYENHPSLNLTYNQIVDGALNSYNHFLEIYTDVLGDIDTSMNRSLDEFKTEPEYAQNIYTRGIIMFDSLRSEIGEKKLYSCIKGYFKEFKFKNANSDEFIAYFSKKSGRNLDSFFDSWLEGKVKFVGA